MTSTKTVVLPVGPDHAGQRLDAFLVAQLPWRSRESVAGLIREGAVTVEGRPAKKSRRLGAEDRVVVKVPVDTNAEAELAALAVTVLYEDDDLVVVNKPAGLAVHASSTSMTVNLLNRLERRYRVEHPDPAVVPLLVHRLDRTTSGVIAVAKRRQLVAYYTQQFEQRTTDKEYVAIAQGQLQDSGEIDLGLRVVDRKPVEVADDGLPSLTRYRVLEEGVGASRLAVSIHTGRKHQIRVHLAAIGHPLVGDITYGATVSCLAATGPLLHAASLSLTHRDGRRLRFDAPVPAAMERAWQTFGKRK